MSEYAFKDTVIKQMTVVTKDYMPTNGEHYYIVRMYVDNDYRKGYQYGIINHKDVNEKGKLTRTLNGFQMQLSDTVAQLLAKVEQGIEIDRLAEAENISRTAAILLYFGTDKMTKEKAVELAKEFEKI